MMRVHSQAFRILSHLASVSPDSSTLTNILAGKTVINRLVKAGLVRQFPADTYQITHAGRVELDRRMRMLHVGAS